MMMAVAAMSDPKANAVDVARRLNNHDHDAVCFYVHGDGTLKQAGRKILIEA